MRTTIDIEDDVLNAVKEMAQQQHISAGKIISQLLRASLSGANRKKSVKSTTITGFHPFTAHDSQIVTEEQINQIRDLDGI